VSVKEIIAAWSEADKAAFIRLVKKGAAWRSLVLSTRASLLDELSAAAVDGDRKLMMAASYRLAALGELDARIEWAASELEAPQLPLSAVDRA